MSSSILASVQRKFKLRKSPNKDQADEQTLDQWQAGDPSTGIISNSWDSLPFRSYTREIQSDTTEEQDDGEEEDNVDMPSDTIDPSLIAFWLNSCEQHHGVECSRRELYADSSNEMEIILIDVRRKCLVRLTTAVRYFALSYVWGGVPQLRNTTALCEILMVPHALTAHKGAIPQVIVDSIELVYSLGETYLWVDSLCIVQDDAAAKHYQISHMAKIYSSAILTLVAVRARHANSDLPGVRPGTRWPRSWKQEQNELRRPLRPDLVFKAIDRSVYASRAWTFQERQLSRRCLYFSDEQLYFQCRKELWCEEPSPILSSGLLHDLPLDMELNIMSRAPGWTTGGLEQAFAFYAEIVQEYSRKSLSYPEDIMNAFSGIVTALEMHSTWTIMHGLPEQLLELALLWVPAGMPQRRLSPRSGHLSEFPSWSWIGWVGPVTFNMAFASLYITESRLIKDIQMEGFIENKRSLFKLPRGLSASEESNIKNDFPILNNHGASTHGRVLRFFTWVIDAAALRFIQMPPWEWSQHSSDKRVMGEQDGVFLSRGKEIAGLLLGISMEDLREFEGSQLRLITISWGDPSWRLLLVSRQQHQFPRILTFPWNNHFYLHRPGQGFDRTPEYNPVYNVMLVRTKGLYSERVAVGQIKVQFWDAAEPIGDTIRLV